MKFKEGDIFLDKYEILSALASSHYCEVYKITEILSETNCVLKIFPSSPDLTGERRFRKVLSTISQRKIEGVSNIIEWGIEKDFFFWVEEFLQGVILTSLIKARSGGKPYKLEEMESIIAPLVETLDDIHVNFPHLLIHPDNIIILPERPHLTDYGKSLCFDREKIIEMGSSREEKFLYLAPEFLKGETKISTSSDIYSLGIILYELLTLQKPPEEANIPPSEINEDLTVDVDDFVLRCISKNPDERIQSTKDFLEQFSFVVGKEIKGGSNKKVYDLEEIFLEETETFKKEELLDIFEDIKGIGQEGKAVEVEKFEEPEVKIEKGKFSLFLKAAAAAIVVIGLSALVVFAFKHFKKTAQESQETKISKARESFPQEKTEPVHKYTIPQTVSASQVTSPVHKEKIEKKERKEVVKIPAKEEEAKPQKSRSLKVASVEKSSPPQKGSKIKVPPIKKIKKTVPPKEQKPCPEGMVLIPSGSVVLGSSQNDEYWDPTDLKEEKKYVSEFCIDKYEYPNKKGKKPMIKVTWNEAKKLCQKEGKRLCKEEEWERACKGTKNTRYPYGNEWNGSVCVTEDSKGRDRYLYSSGLALKCKSEFGVYDLSGNAAEWVKDLFEKGLKDRTVKGGSFKRPDYATRCASRKNLSPEVRDDEVGFRCCADPRK